MAIIMKIKIFLYFQNSPDEARQSKVSGDRTTTSKLRELLSFHVSGELLMHKPIIRNCEYLDENKGNRNIYNFHSLDIILIWTFELVNASTCCS